MSQTGPDPRTVRPWRMIERRKSRTIKVGSLEVGGDAPITVQTMTNTPTADAGATIDQIRRCEEAGADLVRVSCPDEDSTAAFREIAKAATVPLIADIHSTTSAVSKRPKRAPPACGSIRAISVRWTG